MPRLETARTVCRLHTSADIEQVLQYRLRNRAHLQPWEPLHDESYYSRESVARGLAQAHAAVRLEQGYPFCIFSPDESEVWGTFTFANIVRGVFQACHLGYGLAIDRQGRGLMQEALESGLQWAFGELGLHRVMANYMPANVRSGALLNRLGFEREGYARNYLKIAGRWQDHVLTARVAPSADGSVDV
ncbi:GNAT family N-acetyltransferase [Frateuria aurantia]